MSEDRRTARRRGLRLACAAAGLLAAVAVAVAARLYWAEDEPAPDLAPRAFVEAGAEAGLLWQMRFLPGEQGETFKINLYDHGCGVAVGDYDGDGKDDVYFCNQLGPNALYRNKGDGTFEEAAGRAGVAVGDRVCVGAAFADYDNDGRQDLYVTSTRGGNLLFRNKGGGRFEDVTKKAGVGHVGHSQGALFFDYDGDGDLDLFLTNTAAWTSEVYDNASRYWVGKGQFGGVLLSPKEENVLYRNDGDGTFADATASAGLKGRGWAGDACAFDYDGDGRPDLLVTSMFGRAQLYRNSGGGAFEDVTLKVLGRTPWGGLGALPFDGSGSGRLDLFVADMHSDMWMGPDWDHTSLEQAHSMGTAKYPDLFGPRTKQDPSLIEREKELGEQVGFRREEVLFGNGYYRNDGDGRFSERSDAAGLETFWPWGAAAGDLDNDGREDLFVPSGMGYPFYYWPNAALMNNGDGSFSDRAADLGFEPPTGGQFLPARIGGRQAARSSRSAAVADFDGDGRLEVVVNNFNDRPYLFRNRGAGRNYVALRLRGTASNRDAVGAVVRLHSGGRVMTRQVSGSCGYLSQSSRAVHFGLGAGGIDGVEITWPSGRRQLLTGVKRNALHEVVEPAG